VQHLSFDHSLAVFIDSVMLILLAYQIVRISNDLVAYVIKTFRFVGKKEDKTTVSMVILVIQIIVRVIAVLLILMNIGIEITPLLASLGI
jgi:small-conductance mechanosensitive channel